MKHPSCSHCSRTADSRTRDHAGCQGNQENAPINRTPGQNFSAMPHVLAREAGRDQFLDYRGAGTASIFKHHGCMAPPPALHDIAPDNRFAGLAARAKKERDANPRAAWTMTPVPIDGPAKAKRRWALPAFRDSLWLLAPIGLLYGVFALVPFALIVRFALTDGGGPFSTVLRSPLLLRAATNTLVISILTTAVAVVIAYVLAAGLWRAGPTLRSVLLGFVLLPFWTAVLIKNFAWAALLQDNGLVNTLLQESGLTSAPITLLHNRFAVIVGMVHYVLPYAVFPIFNAMQAIDRNVERAARSLGANNASVIRLIVLPLTLPGVYSATLLVFVVSIGFFITPVILGAPSDMMIANLVRYYVHELVDFNAGSALAVLILSAIIPLIVLQQSLPREGRYGAV